MDNTTYVFRKIDSGFEASTIEFPDLIGIGITKGEAIEKLDVKIESKRSILEESRKAVLLQLTEAIQKVQQIGLTKKEIANFIKRHFSPELPSLIKTPTNLSEEAKSLLSLLKSTEHGYSNLKLKQVFSGDYERAKSELLSARLVKLQRGRFGSIKRII